MSEGKPKSVLDLIPGGPIRSDPFDFKGQSVRWRLLDGAEVMACRHAAERRVVDHLVSEIGLDAKDAYAIASSGVDSQREWFEYYMLAAAMTDTEGAPISSDTPDDMALSLADKTTPIERAKFMGDYLEFADEHDPSNLTEADLEEIIADLGKGADSILSQFGSNALRSLLLSMGPRLARAEAAAERVDHAETLEARIESLEQEISRIRRSSDGSA